MEPPPSSRPPQATPVPVLEPGMPRRQTFVPLFDTLAMGPSMACPPPIFTYDPDELIRFQDTYEGHFQRNSNPLSTQATLLPTDISVRSCSTRFTMDRITFSDTAKFKLEFTSRPFALESWLPSLRPGAAAPTPGEDPAKYVATLGLTHMPSTGSQLGSMLQGVELATFLRGLELSLQGPDFSLNVDVYRRFPAISAGSGRRIGNLGEPQNSSSPGSEVWGRVGGPSSFGSLRQAVPIKVAGVLRIPDSCHFVGVKLSNDAANTKDVHASVFLASQPRNSVYLMGSRAAGKSSSGSENFLQRLLNRSAFVYGVNYLRDTNARKHGEQNPEEWNTFLQCDTPIKNLLGDASLSASATLSHTQRRVSHIGVLARQMLFYQAGKDRHLSLMGGCTWEERGERGLVWQTTTLSVDGRWGKFGGSVFATRTGSDPFHYGLGFSLPGMF